MEKENAKAIKGIVDGLLKDWEKERIFKADAVEEAWQKAVGKRALKHTKVATLKSGRLIIEVDESGWIYQLTLKKRAILKALKKQLKNININEIQFRIGDIS